MADFFVDRSGKCTNCHMEANEADVVDCYDCREFYHGVCNNQTPFGCKTFIYSFKKQKNSNFIFMCNSCIMKRELHEASTMKDQIEALTKTVSVLANEFKSFKEENSARFAWSSQQIIAQKMKASLCIKSNRGETVDM